MPRLSQIKDAIGRYNPTNEERTHIMTPKPEHRISAVEKRVTTLEGTIEELSSDQAEELKAIRLEIKQLNDGMMASFKQIGDTFVRIEESLEAAKSTMATKEDISRLEARIDHIEASQGAKLDQILALLQKSGE